MIRRTIVAVCGGACLVFALLAFGGCAQSVERELLDAYEGHPSEETRNAVVEALTNGRFSRREGNRALKLLVSPRVTARPAHSTDCVISLLIEHPWRPEELRLDSGALVVGDVENKLAFGTRPCLFFRSRPSRYCLSSCGDLIGLADVHLPEGRHHAQIVLSYAFRYRTVKRKLKVEWEGVSKLMNFPLPDISRPEFIRWKSYTFDVALPIALDVKPPASVPDVALRCNEALDATMRECIMADVYLDAASVPPSHVVESGEWRWAIALHGISIRSLPESVSFRVFVVDEQGQRRSLPSLDDISCAAPLLNPDPFMIVLRAGELADVPFETLLIMKTLRKTCERAGRHHLMLLLEPDAEAAWCDPAIETIWGGSMEIPFNVWTTRR